MMSITKTVAAFLGLFALAYMTRIYEAMMHSAATSNLYVRLTLTQTQTQQLLAVFLLLVLASIPLAMPGTMVRAYAGVRRLFGEGVQREARLQA